MTTCPKCGGAATDAVIKRQGHCSRCREKIEEQARMRDQFAYIIVRADMAGLEPGIEIDAPKYAAWVWALADALSKARPV